MTLADFKNSWMAKSNSPAIFISATEKENIDEFKDLLYDRVKAVNQQIYPYNNFLY
jgi:GTP-binding protein HflX